ncbi:MAG: site-specific DNA-methyltransferase [Promethearchaeia archaeon]|nr:MAG: site-specific DNA-methyltransferase [Candidatus Lokiarchaeia archaeon]
MIDSPKNLHRFLQEFTLDSLKNLKSSQNNTEETQTQVKFFQLDSVKVPKYINEFWTAKQRQGHSLHEISYRACFKAQLPRFFIELFTTEGDIVYDPFSGRGTTVIEAGLLNRQIIQNDVNPLSKILCKPRFFIPTLSDIKDRLENLSINYSQRAEIDLSMFYHPKTEAEIVSLRNYLLQRHQLGEEDEIDQWIRMVATNRLTGHSTGFFSVYTLPPNQAVSAERQRKINEKRSQVPEYRPIIHRILKKSKSLMRNLSPIQKENLRKNGKNGLFLSKDARYTPEIKDDSIQLIVTSPPFLNVVQYSQDNWLRGWFNSLNIDEIDQKIMCTSNIREWQNFMAECFNEFHHKVKPNGWVAFEVGEVNRGTTSLDELILPIGCKAGFIPIAILINQQVFTKTSNIWGISNNKRGTNSKRIVLFQKKS